MQLIIDSVIDAAADDGTTGQQIMAYGEGVSPRRVYIQFWIPSTDPAYQTLKVGQAITVA